MRYPITISAAIAALLVGTGSDLSLAADETDLLGALPALGEGELAGLSGRQGISISDQDLAAITQGGQFAADQIETGTIDFGSSMNRMSGINNQAVNTGNNASVNAGMAVHIHLY